MPEARFQHDPDREANFGALPPEGLGEVGCDKKWEAEVSSRRSAQSHDGRGRLALLGFAKTGCRGEARFEHQPIREANFSNPLPDGYGEAISPEDRHTSATSMAGPCLPVHATEPGGRGGLPTGLARSLDLEMSARRPATVGTAQRGGESSHLGLWPVEPVAAPSDDDRSLVPVCQVQCGFRQLRTARAGPTASFRSALHRRSAPAFPSARATHPCIGRSSGGAITALSSDQQVRVMLRLSDGRDHLA